MLARSRSPLTHEQQAMVHANLRLIWFTAKRFYGRFGSGLRCDYEDLLGVGWMALADAARKYDPGRKVKFVTYAYWSIYYRLWGEFLFSCGVIRVPKSQRKYLRAHPHLADAVRRANRCRSLPTVGGPGGTEGYDGWRPIDPRQREAETVVSEREDLARMLDALPSLPPREQRILRLFYGMDGRGHRTLTEIGDLIGVTKERVNQLRRAALRTLRERLSPQEAIS